MPGEVDPDDPWSRDIPVPDAPVRFTFPTNDVPETAEADAPRLDGASGGGSVSAVGRDADAPAGSARRRWWIAAVTVALLAGFGVVAVGDRGGSDDSGSADTATESTVPASTAPATTAVAGTSTTVVESTLATAPATTGVQLPPPLTWWDSTHAVLPVFAGMDPAPQLVVLTMSGVVGEIDLATGATRSLDLDRPAGSVQVDVASTAALLVPTAGPSFRPLLIPSGGEPIELDLAEYEGLWTWTSVLDADEFFAEAWSSSEGRSAALRIGLDGSVTESLDIDGRFGASALPGGRQLVGDAGGVYLVAVDGTTSRLSTGALVANSANAVLVKECDEQRVCSHWVIDVVTGERRPAIVADGDELDGFFSPAALAPDGSHLATVAFGGGEPSIRFVDLTDGSVVDAPGLGDFVPGAVVWAPDSSGAFTSDGGTVVYVDRQTADVTEIPVDVDQGGVDIVVDLGVRTAG